MIAHQLQWSTATVREDLVVKLRFVGSDTRSSLLLIGRIHGRIRERAAGVASRGARASPSSGIRVNGCPLPSVHKLRRAIDWDRQKVAIHSSTQSSNSLPTRPPTDVASSADRCPRSSQEQRPASSPDPHSDINARSSWQVCLRACCCVHGMHAVSPPHQVTPFGTLLIPWCWCSVRRQAGREDAKPVRGRCASCTYCHDSLRRPSAVDRSNCLTVATRC